MRLHIVSHFLICFCVIHYSDGQSVIWYEPLPVETVTSSTTDLPPAEMKVFEGYPASLSWNFSLTSLTLFVATIKFDTVTLALSGSGGSGANVEDAFKDRFNLTWISQRITLVIFNVTASDDASNGAFECELGTNKGSWSRDIRLNIIARTFTWTAPPPAWTPTDGNDIRTVNFPALNGSTNVALRWNYVLGGGEGLFLTTWIFNGNQIALLTTLPSAIISDDRFAVNTREVATLIIKNVSDITDGTIQCVAHTSVSVWKYNIQVEITVPPKITSTGDSQIVTEGSGLVLFCNATGKPAPNITWTRVLEVGTDSQELFVGNPWIIVNISRTSTGTYRCTADNGIGSPVNHTISMKVLFPPKITSASDSQNVTEGSELVLFCNGTGKPQPNITWTRVLDGGTDSQELFVGNPWIIVNISRTSTGTYRCTADNGIGSPVNHTISMKVLFPPKITSASDSQNVTEGSELVLFCNGTGKPQPNITWTRVLEVGTDSQELFVGNPWIIVNISRTSTGTYRCTADNGIGSPVNHTISMKVLFGIKDVTLERNTTENNGCNDFWVNFTCKSSVANPPVHDYLLLKNENKVSFSEKGTWIEKISRGETFVYECRAYQKIDNVTSSNNVTVAVNEPPALEQLQNKTVDEHENLLVECNVTAGTPSPTVFWENIKSGHVIEGKLLNVTNITRNQTDYRCIANNTCGGKYATMFIDVQYEPDQVNLDTAPSGTVCLGSTVEFICTADANPPVHAYVLYKNGTRDSTDKFGIWTKIMSVGGKFFFKCEAHSTKGNSMSNDILLNAHDKPTVEQVQNVTVNEGTNVTKECNTTAGTPPLTVFWQNVKTGDTTGKLLTITNIKRSQRGEYRCIANNDCGKDSTTIFIDVQCKNIHNTYFLKIFGVH
ncbi:hemicentin-2-like [Stylophora pistillata]|uniref:hemicentin-2-like n=1 Tax=Stylophora pistillata TaxID=50429 RepID=UPI000C0503DC|nr:hemicentin-2-like [Stylophora pistillata]